MKIINDFCGCYFTEYQHRLVTESDYKNKMRNYNGITCIYFLVSEQKIVYVGETINLRNRLTTHKRNKDFSTVYVIQCEDRWVSTLIEKSAIAHFKPPFNTMHKNKAVYDVFAEHNNYMEITIGISAASELVSKHNERFNKVFPAFVLYGGY